MPRNHKKPTSNIHSNGCTRKSKDKPTYKIIILGSGGVGKVRIYVFNFTFAYFRTIIY